MSSIKHVKVKMLIKSKNGANDNTPKKSEKVPHGLQSTPSSTRFNGRHKRHVVFKSDGGNDMYHYKPLKKIKKKICTPLFG